MGFGLAQQHLQRRGDRHFRRFQRLSGLMTGHFRAGDHYRYFENGTQVCATCGTPHDWPHTLCPACRAANNLFLMCERLQAAKGSRL